MRAARKVGPMAVSMAAMMVAPRVVVMVASWVVLSVVWTAHPSAVKLVLTMAAD